MIERLRISGVIVEEEKEDEVISILQSTNYYRLSVFALYLEEDRRFQHPINLYHFDRFLRESINHLIPSIEISLKTSLAFYLSINYQDIGEVLIVPKL
jgi:abortive infection bacteriophage resistance protein